MDERTHTPSERAQLARARFDKIAQDWRDLQAVINSLHPPRVEAVAGEPLYIPATSTAMGELAEKVARLADRVDAEKSGTESALGILSGRICELERPADKAPGNTPPSPGAAFLAFDGGSHKAADTINEWGGEIDAKVARLRERVFNCERANDSTFAALAERLAELESKPPAIGTTAPGGVLQIQHLDADGLEALRQFHEDSTKLGERAKQLARRVDKIHYERQEEQLGTAARDTNDGLSGRIDDVKSMVEDILGRAQQIEDKLEGLGVVLR